ncbi:MAG: type 1 fimbrial protein [Acinetobacter sp.]|nr:type 1 fimbrial protein [Acinetobacter sp.]MDN5491202.1 type 1 fimbrial protein [Acinetobacter sp.]MDN5648547.1 type 1 fimbrial protein [Acinetobacter sp.]
MKKLTLATLSTLALTLACTNVFALDGTITVNGAVTDQTCTLQASSSSGGFATGLKDITFTLPTAPKSKFTPGSSPIGASVNLFFKNASGTGPCDAATTKAFKGIHLSAISPDHLDTADKTLLVNQASGASAANPIFMRFITDGFDNVGGGMAGIRSVDFSAPWGNQAKSSIGNHGGNIYVVYNVVVFSKTGIVDAQNYTATVNYTLHYN